VDTTTTKEKVLHIRLDDKEMETVTDLAKRIYGFRSAGEFVRYAIAHIDKTRPTLGKDFAPEMAR
jgi:hypothetical protein